MLRTSSASGADSVRADTPLVSTTFSIRGFAAGLHLHTAQIVALRVCFAGYALQEEVVFAADTFLVAVFGTLGGLASNALGTFADLLSATLTVRGVCANSQCLFSESVAVGPFRALVVTAQPIRVIALDALSVAVVRTSSAAGACAVLAFAFFESAALRVICVGSSLCFDLALAVTISPRKTDYATQIKIT